MVELSAVQNFVWLLQYFLCRFFSVDWIHRQVRKSAWWTCLAAAFPRNKFFLRRFVLTGVVMFFPVCNSWKHTAAISVFVGPSVCLLDFFPFSSIFRRTRRIFDFRIFRSAIHSVFHFLGILIASVRNIMYSRLSIFGNLIARQSAYILPCNKARISAFPNSNGVFISNFSYLPFFPGT